MIKATYVEKDKVVSKTVEKAPQASFVWYHCVKPSEDDLQLLAEITKIDKENLAVASDEEIHPYADKEKFVELVYRAPLLEDGDVVTEPLIIFFRKKFVVTLTAEKLKAVSQLENQFARNRQKFLLEETGAYFVFNLLDVVNDDFLNRVNKITRAVDLAERAPEDAKNYQKLYQASLTSAHFNRALLGNIDALNTLRKMHHSDIADEDHDNFIDLYREALQILDTERIQRELIANLFTFQNVLANQKVERKLHMLTFLAVLVTVPTMISSIYGMNVKLPFEQNPFAFWIITGVMLLVAIILIMFFMLRE